MRELGTILAVWAHPDDEVYSCGGIMAAAIRDGQRVVCVTATRGELGSNDESARGEQLAAIRTEELAECLRILGVTEHHWLDYADGGCADVSDDEGSAHVARFIEDVRPDTILTFGPDGATGHPDHIAVGRWTTLAVAKTATPAKLHYAANPRDWQEKHFDTLDSMGVFMGFQPPKPERDELSIDYEFDGDLLDLKMAAVRAQASQSAPIFDALGEELGREMLAGEWFVPAP